MFEIILSVTSGALVCSGVLFFIGASVGLVRFPDFYTRMHAAGKGDTLSTILILLGVALYQFHDLDSKEFDLEHLKLALLVAIKITAISVLIMMTSPTSTHSLTEAGYDDGLEPYTGDEKNNEGSDNGKQENDSAGA